MVLFLQNCQWKGDPDTVGASSKIVFDLVWATTKTMSEALYQAGRYGPDALVWCWLLFSWFS